jgi:Protein of unknown function (DUF992)
MVRLTSVLVVAGLIAAAAVPGSARSAPRAAIVIESARTVGITTTVAAIDYARRLVTLTDPLGNKAVFHAGPEVRGFDLVHTGETVPASYVLREVVTVLAPGARAPAMRDAVTVPRGARPDADSRDTVQFAARVEAVDYQERTIWLRGPNGRDVHVAVAPNVPSLEQIHQGNRVIYRATATLSAIGAVPVADGVKAGLLACQISPSVGFIVGSFQSMSCRFTPDSGAPPESYTGTINRLGLDIGVTGGRRLAWAVYAPTRGLAPGGLAGAYVGASGDASLGVGVGANFLLGGSNNTVALQPFSIENQFGVSLALGIANLQLSPAP